MPLTFQLSQADDTRVGFAFTFLTKQQLPPIMKNIGVFFPKMMTVVLIISTQLPCNFTFKTNSVILYGVIHKSRIKHCSVADIVLIGSMCCGGSINSGVRPG